MTVSASTTKHIYDGNGSTYLWPYTFKIILSTDIKLYKTAADGTITEITANYLVDTNNSRVEYPTPASGLPALTSSEKITLARTEPLTQGVDLQEQGAFSAEVLEGSLDKLTMMVQELTEKSDRSIKWPIDETPTSEETETYLDLLVAERVAAEAAASDASGYAATATTQAGIATTKASDASGSAATASSDAADASGSAAAAAISASDASGSAASASSSASDASGSAAAALGYMNDASGFAADASGSAADASGSAVAAALSESNALGYESDASGYAASAAQSATDASGSAADAAASAASISDPLLRDDINEATAGHGVGVQGNRIIKSDVQLTGSVDDGFPNDTTLYIWDAPTGASGNYVNQKGGIDLSLTGALTQSNDVLGVSRYNVFDGSNDYLSSDNALLTGINGDFSIGIWAYSADWTTNQDGVLMSRWSTSGGNNGWQLLLGTAPSNLIFKTFSSNYSTSEFNTSVTGLTPGWHFFSVVRDADVGVWIYIDLNLVASLSDTSMTIGNGGNFEIGSFNGGNTKFTGGIGQSFMHNGTILNANEIRNLYARSARKFAAKSADGTVVADSSIMSVPYLSGTFTPIILNTGAGNTPQYSAKKGRYTRIGGYAFFEIEFSTATGTAGSDSGQLAVTNLPFRAGPSMGVPHQPIGRRINGSFDYIAYGYVQEATRVLYLYQKTTIDGGYIGMTGADQDNATRGLYLAFGMMCE